MANSTSTYQEKTYKYMKAQIMNLGFKPGEYVTDTQIANVLNVSRTPVREAFRILEHEGLLIYETRRGWKVYSLTLEDIKEIFALKIIIEKMIAVRAASCEDNQLREKLAVCLQEMKEAMINNNVDLWIKKDTDLHHIIHQMANSKRAESIVENLNDQWHRLRIGFTARTDRMQRSYKEHEEIVKAILEKDNTQAEKATQIHLALVQEELINLLKNLVLPFVSKGI